MGRLAVLVTLVPLLAHADASVGAAAPSTMTYAAPDDASKRAPADYQLTEWKRGDTPCVRVERQGGRPSLELGQRVTVVAVGERRRLGARVDRSYRVRAGAVEHEVTGGE